MLWYIFPMIIFRLKIKNDYAVGNMVLIKNCFPF